MSRLVARGVAVLVFAALAAGCAGPRAHDMLLPYTTPATASEVAGTHQIFIATTRGRAKDKAQVFDGSRSEALSLARVTVTVPPTHQTGKIERPSGRVANPAKYFTASDFVTIADQQAFVAAMRPDIARHGGRVL